MGHYVYLRIMFGLWLNFTLVVNLPNTTLFYLGWGLQLKLVKLMKSSTNMVNNISYYSNCTMLTQTHVEIYALLIYMRLLYMWVVRALF